MNLKTKEGGNFAYLTLALVIMLFVSAVADSLSMISSYRLVQSATVMTLAVGIWSSKDVPYWFQSSIGFFVATLAVTVAGLIFDNAGLHYTHLAIMLGFMVFSVREAFRQMLFTGAVNQDKIIGTVCVYLLIGIIWALLYIILAMIAPESFKGILVSKHWQQDFNEFVYFSFVTLTTLGFGDMVPVTPLAKFLVYMEAIIGQFYIAILVASLIGVRVADIRKES